MTKLIPGFHAAPASVYDTVIRPAGMWRGTWERGVCVKGAINSPLSPWQDGFTQVEGKQAWLLLHWLFL